MKKGLPAKGDLFGAIYILYRSGSAETDKSHHMLKIQTWYLFQFIELPGQGFPLHYDPKKINPFG